MKSSVHVTLHYMCWLVDTVKLTQAGVVLEEKLTWENAPIRLIDGKVSEQYNILIGDLSRRTQFKVGSATPRLVTLGAIRI